MCFGSLEWCVLLPSYYSLQAAVMLLTVCMLVSLPCMLMKDITLFSPSQLGQDALCLLCLFQSGLLVDPGLPWSGPFLLNGSGGCVGALSWFQFGIWLCCVVLWLMGGSRKGGSAGRKQKANIYFFFFTMYLPKASFELDVKENKRQSPCRNEITPCLIFSLESTVWVLREAAAFTALEFNDTAFKPKQGWREANGEGSKKGEKGALRLWTWIELQE